MTRPHPTGPRIRMDGTPRKERTDYRKCAIAVTRSEIERRLSRRGIEIIGELSSPLKTAEFKGICGHIWKMQTRAMINGGTSCPVCFEQAARDRVLEEIREAEMLCAFYGAGYDSD